MLGKILLFPFVGVLRFVRFLYRSLLTALVVAAAHTAIGLLLGRINLPSRLFEGFVIGLLAGLVDGAYRAATRPNVPATPAPPRHFGLLDGVKFLFRRGLIAVPVLLGLALVAGSASHQFALEWVLSEAANPNPPPPVDAAALFSTPPEEACGEAAFCLETKPALAANLANVYGNPHFAAMSLARAHFQNGTEETVRAYRVRFRLPEYTHDWSPWSAPAEVAPGAKVCTPYHPILDAAKLARLDTNTATELQVQYEYRTAGGLVQRSDSRRLDVLGRNMMLMESKAAWEERKDPEKTKDPNSLFWQESYALVPYLLPTFVTKDDPLIQQVAGWVSGQAGGTPSLSDADAVQFMNALFDFMVANIRYQTPPADGAGAWVVQHVKYGRDVLRNRAGNCLDLAIFYASVCEAVGLEPVLIFTPSHAYAVVRMPQSGLLLPVEATMVGHTRLRGERNNLNYLVNCFEVATLVGADHLDHDRQGPHIEVDIVAQHTAGIRGLQLEPVEANALASWGIRPVESAPVWQTLAYWAALTAVILVVRGWRRLARLARQLKNADPWVRYQAVRALAAELSVRSTRLLVQAAGDLDDRVRGAAEAALKERAGPTPRGLTRRPGGWPTLRAARRALAAVVRGEFDSVMICKQPQQT
jgi:hypothetical protein